MLFHALLIGVERRHCGVFLQLPCKVLVSFWGGCICTCEMVKEKVCGQRKITENEVCRDICFLLFWLFIFFPSECLLDLSSVMQEVTQSSEQSQVMYCICLNHPSLLPLTLRVCWRLKLKLRFLNQCLELGKT